MAPEVAAAIRGWRQKSPPDLSTVRTSEYAFYDYTFPKGLGLR
jgi:hypothetical protein